MKKIYSGILCFAVCLAGASYAAAQTGENKYSRLDSAEFYTIAHEVIQELGRRKNINMSAEAKLNQAAEKEAEERIVSLISAQINNRPLAEYYMQTFNAYIHNTRPYLFSAADLKRRYMTGDEFKAKIAKNRTVFDYYLASFALTHDFYESRKIVDNIIIAAETMTKGSYLAFSKIDGDYYFHVFKTYDRNFEFSPKREKCSLYLVSYNDFFPNKFFKKELIKKGFI
ncbi:hypothetical protein Dip518_001096 [Parelusimicrobium proximum]|uniref:hypothetical protein n=1 Tax=Parelusimicrobium proximum TaxID=3228953 RepID=UPI003D17AD3E